MSRTNPAEQLAGPREKSAQSYDNLLIYSELYGDVKRLQTLYCESNYMVYIDQKQALLLPFCMTFSIFDMFYNFIK